MYRKIVREDIFMEIGTNRESRLKAIGDYNPVAFMMEKCYTMEEI